MQGWGLSSHLSLTLLFGQGRRDGPWRMIVNYHKLNEVAVVAPVPDVLSLLVQINLSPNTGHIVTDLAKAFVLVLAHNNR